MSNPSQELICDECKKGYADCVCSSDWATPAEREERALEIRQIKVEVYAKLEKPARPKRFIETLDVELPSDLVAYLRSHAGPRKLSAYVERLLTVHSSPPDQALRLAGAPERVSLTLPKRLTVRLRTRAKLESTNPTLVLEKHLAKELAREGEED